MPERGYRAGDLERCSRLLRAAAFMARTRHWLGQFATTNQVLDMQVGYVAGRAPREREFSRALEAEHERMRTFLRPRPPAK